jgi:hypothetical protein
MKGRETSCFRPYTTREKVIKLLFSLIGVWAIRVIGAVIVIVYIFKNANDARKTDKIWISIISYLIIFFISKPVLLYDFRSPSKVNIKPLYALNGIEYIDSESIEVILDIIEEREDFGSVRRYSGTKFDSFEFFWHGNTNHNEPGGASVSFWYSSSFEGAEANFATDWGKCKRISVSDYIKANLYHSEMYRSADSFFAADWRKHGRTHILIGNIMIIIVERESFFRIGKWTSGRIEALSEIFVSVMLESEAEPGD